MQVIILIARLLDTIISISILLVGMYMFFWKGEYLTGSIVIGMHSLYSTNVLLGSWYMHIKKPVINNYTIRFANDKDKDEQSRSKG